MDNLLINVGKLHKELLAAGLPVTSVHSNGTVDYSRALSAAESLNVKGLIAAHDPVAIIPPTTDQIVHALWMKVMLGDSKEADKILQIMK